MRLTYLVFVLLGLFWGSNFIYMKWAAEFITPAQITLLRVFFGFPPLALVAWRKGVIHRDQLRHLPHFFVMAVLATAFYYFAIAEGTALLPSGIAGVLGGSISLFTTIATLLFLRTDVNRDACKACSLRERCTKSFRRVSRLENEAVLDRMAKRLAARPDILDRRRESVQHPFGTIKQWMYQGAFLMRRLENVRGEFSLPALAYNIRRAITLVGVPGLIAAVRA
jgi:hypothetical protein